MLQKVIDASVVAKAMCDEAAESYSLQGCVIDGDLNLRFTQISLCIEITECVFTGKVDVCNAVFEGTVLFRNCRFKGDVNGGDDELTNTVFKADLSFDGSIFYGFVSFIGFACEASVSFRRCTFEATAIRNSEMMGLRNPVEFIGGKVGKAFSVNKSEFKGGVSFNGLRCDYAGFFHGVRFGNNKKLPVDFVASSYGIACDLKGAVFEGDANLNSVTCHLFNAMGAIFAGNADISGLTCYVAQFNPYQISIDDEMVGPLVEGPLPPALNLALKKEGFDIGENYTLSLREERWLVLDENGEQRAYIEFQGGRMLLYVVSNFIGDYLSLDYGTISSNLNLSAALVKCDATFYGLDCHGGGFFYKTLFDKSVDFRYGRYGNFHAEGAVFKGVANLSNISCSEIDAMGAIFAGEAAFTSLTCYEARFDPYQIPLDDEMSGLFVEGQLPPELNLALKKEGFDIGENCTFSLRGKRWLVLDENGEQRAYIEFQGERILLNVVSKFTGEKLSLDHGKIGWIIVLNNALVKCDATFNGLDCNGGGFFQETQFEFDGPIDFRYGRYGKNLQMEGMQVRSMAKFEGVSINSDLVFDDKTIFHEGADFTGAKIRRVKLSYSSNPSRKKQSIFRKKQCVFNSCTFDFFDGEWREFVDHQDPDQFSLDPYLALEKSKRAAGEPSEADMIYYVGRRAQTWHEITHRDWRRFIPDIWWLVFTGYGVRRIRLFICCVLFIFISVVFYWPTNALRSARKEGDAIPQYSAVQRIQPPSDRGINIGEDCLSRFVDNSSSLDDTKSAGGLKKSGIDVSINDPMLLTRLVSRLTYSVGEFLPVNLEITKLCHPAPGWLQVYSAINKLAGWILVPLLAAAIAGFLGKR